MEWGMGWRWDWWGEEFVVVGVRWDGRLEGDGEASRRRATCFPLVFNYYIYICIYIYTYIYVYCVYIYIYSSNMAFN